MKTRRQRIGEWLEEKSRRVREHLAGQVICTRCGATADTYNAACTARLDDPCPGFRTIEAANEAVSASFPMPGRVRA